MKSEYTTNSDRFNAVGIIRAVALEMKPQVIFFQLERDHSQWLVIGLVLFPFSPSLSGLTG
jgi:hypothetical protein